MTTTRTCPRCGESYKSQVCWNCGLRFRCTECGTTYEDPMGASSCQQCGTPVEQPPWATAAEEATSLTPLPRVAAAIGRYSAAGALRAATAQYGAALLAGGDAKVALDVLTAAIDAPGDEPRTSDLLLLRGYANELAGALDAAVGDLLRTATGLRSLPAGVQQRVHDLLDRSTSARQLMLDAWARQRWRAATIPRRQADLLALHAAILEDDETRALDAAGRCAARRGGSDEAAGLLRRLQSHPDLPSTRHLLLGRLFERLGDLEAALTEADNVGSYGSADQTIAAALALQAELLERLERPSEAGSRYREAGETLIWLDDYGGALPPLRKAIELRSADPEPRWLVAECLRLSCQTAPDPVRVLRDATVEWENGLRVAGRAQFSALAGRTRALIAWDICDDDAPGTRRGHLLAGIAALEDTVALGESVSWDWTWLSREHMQLGHLATALCTRQAAPPEHAPNAEVLLQDALLALYAGTDDAPQVVDRYAAHSAANAKMAGWTLLLTGRAHEATVALRRSISEAPDDMQSHWLLGRALRATEGEDRGDESFAEAWRLWEQRQGRDEYQYKKVAANVAYRRGEYERATALTEELVGRLADRTDEMTEVLKTLVLCRLAQGDLAGAAAAFDDALAGAVMVVDAIEFGTDLDELAIGRAATPLPSAGARLATELAGRARAAATELAAHTRDRAAAHAEQQRVLDSSPDRDSAAACYLTIARLEFEEGRFAESADAAVEALRRRPWSPAAAIRLTASADQLLRAGQLALALPRLAAAADLIPVGDYELTGDVLVRLALAAALNGDSPLAEEALTRGLAAYQEHDSSGSGHADVVQVWRDALGDSRGYWRLRHALDDGVSPSQVGALADRCLATMLRLDESDDESAVWPVLTPIALEIASDLVPADTSDTGPMIGDYIPAMRTRLVESITGHLGENDQSWLPGVRVREGSDLPPGGFRVLLSNVAYGAGSVPAGMAFGLASPDAIAALLPEGAAVMAAIDPVTRDSATWLAAEHAELVAVAGIEIWEDPLLFVFRALERHLRQHLDLYLTLDEVSLLHERWKSGYDGRGRSPEVSLPRLTAVVRALARDQVPLTDSGALLAAAAAADGDIDSSEDAYRLAVAAALPGNDADTVRVPVPRKLAAITTPTGRPVDAVAPDAAALFEALAEVRAVLAGLPDRVALVAEGSAARRVVREWLRGEFPDVPVLADYETGESPTAALAAVSAPAGLDAL